MFPEVLPNVINFIFPVFNCKRILLLLDFQFLFMFLITKALRDALRLLISKLSQLLGLPEHTYSLVPFGASQFSWSVKIQYSYRFSGGCLLEFFLTICRQEWSACSGIVMTVKLYHYLTQFISCKIPFFVKLDKILHCSGRMCQQHYTKCLYIRPNM